MKVFEINEKKVQLSIWEEITVKEMRVIYPFLDANTKGQEIEMLISICKNLSPDADVEQVLLSFNMEEFKAFSERFAKLFDIKKKPTEK